MKDSSKSKSTLNAAVPKSDAARKLSEDEKQALELAGRAEHETGRKREILQAQARRKAENG
ncbi:MAG: hypothetical protein WAM53_09470 [Terrimicrobiaceae bacterium]|jgi:hypothetical protein